ncbi:hypothetical protein ABI59_05035 [Acidobacteria bacterium Mor1]|nr:hypothetical protein ABI59_05035 [Acidobacteria bacterium Mor1]
MEILTGDQMRAVDRRTIDELGIPGLLLMESAGREVAEALLEDYEEAAEHVLVVCGKGNNGGDGLVAARHLARRGCAVGVVLCAAEDDLQGDARTNLIAARASGVPIHVVADEESWSSQRGRIDRTPVVLDALLGTGIRGGARGLLRQVILDLNASPTPVASIDVPSGIDADNLDVEGVAVLADTTYTLCRPKPALLLGDAARHTGGLQVLPIGIPHAAVEAENASLSWLDAETLAPLLEPRAPDAHKGTFGHLLAVAGSRDKSGAAALLARGALRSGVGLMTVATSRSGQPHLAPQQAEAMTCGLDENDGGEISDRAVEEILNLAGERHALALGPGLGTADSTRAMVLAVIDGTDRPAVIDADALNAVAAEGPGGLLRLRNRAGLVLTPHPGEAARLLGVTVPAVEADRLGCARRLAAESDAVVVLKGNGSVIAAPDGAAAINSTGNPGMATGGSGDVLTGILGALLARGLSPWNAACLGTYVHGDAGDRGAAARGQEALIATDLIDQIGAAMEALIEETGFTPW